MSRFAVSILRQPGNVHTECFRELIETVDEALRALGHESMLAERNDVPDRTNIIFGSNILANLDHPVAFPPGSVLYNLEQIYEGSPWLTPVVIDALRRHTVWDYSDANVRALARILGIAARWVPVGYVPALTRIAPAPSQDIDVLFIGAPAPRRMDVLTALAKTGARVTAVNGVYGRERDALIARAKIHLNIHFHASRVFEIVRVSYLLANRCFVVSETGQPTTDEAFLAGGVAFASYDNLAAACLRYLQDAPGRAAVAARGFSLMQSRDAAALLLPVVGTGGAPAGR